MCIPQKARLWSRILLYVPSILFNVLNKLIIRSKVELDGDEMTRIIWTKIREEVYFILLNTEFMYPYIAAHSPPSPTRHQVL
jgi:hypothetical protein